MQDRSNVRTHETSDAPLLGPEQDLFGRVGFTRTLAHSIMDLDTSDGSPVIAIHGTWGSGKTTILNLVEAHIRAEAPERYRFLRFNPWLIRDTESMISCFFAEISNVLDEHDGKRILPAPSLPDKKSLAKLVRFGGGFMPVSDDALRTLTSWIHDPSLEVARDEMQKLLEKRAGKDRYAALVVLIDDIDRLESDELMLMLKVVRLTADLSHIVYLLAFDEKITIHQLSTAYGDPDLARLYLEKIVQRPFVVPIIPVERFTEFVVRRTEEAIRQTSFKWISADKKVLLALVTEGFRPRLKTPRQAIRFTSTLHTVLKLVEGEADPLQQVALEGLRVFYPDVFSVTSELRHSEFVSEGADHILDRAQRVTGSGLTTEASMGAKRLLEFLLFGRIPSIEEPVSRPQPMATREYFDRYFSYDIDRCYLSQAEKRALFNPPNADETHIRYIAEFRAERLSQTFPELLRHIGGLRDVAAVGSDQVHVYMSDMLARDVASNLLQGLAPEFGAACDHWHNSTKLIHRNAALVLKKLIRFSWSSKLSELLGGDQERAAIADLLDRLDHLALARTLYYELFDDSSKPASDTFGLPSEPAAFWTSPAFAEDDRRTLGETFSGKIRSRADTDSAYLFRKWPPVFLAGIDIWLSIDADATTAWVREHIEANPDLGLQVLKHYDLGFGMNKEVDRVLPPDAFLRLKARLQSQMDSADFADEHAFLFSNYESTARL